MKKMRERQRELKRRSNSTKMDGDEVRPELYFFEKGEEENKAKEREEMIKKAGVARPSAAGAGSRAAAGSSSRDAKKKNASASEMVGTTSRTKWSAIASRSCSVCFLIFTRWWWCLWTLCLCASAKVALINCVGLRVCGRRTFVVSRMVVARTRSNLDALFLLHLLAPGPALAAALVLAVLPR